MPRQTIKLKLEYDGTDFVGWQYQDNGRSVQESVEKGLSQILQEEIRIVGAGRTDSGVHAKGQVASFSMESSLNCSTIVRSLNGVLPKDIVALEAEQASDGFNARYDARSRRYEYVIKNIPTAISRKYCWVIGYKLDFELMRRCLDDIRGLRDFSSFCKSDSVVKHHNCNVQDASWDKRDDVTLVLDISADRFLHGMVRALVGTMVEIGRGHRPAGDIPRILEARDRRQAGMAAPPVGLFLSEVTYED
jgi:tRNA pseudouridine38-40 synthase